MLNAETNWECETLSRSQFTDSSHPRILDRWKRPIKPEKGSSGEPAGATADAWALSCPEKFETVGRTHWAFVQSKQSSTLQPFSPVTDRGPTLPGHTQLSVHYENTKAFSEMAAGLGRYWGGGFTVSSKLNCTAAKAMALNLAEMSAEASTPSSLSLRCTPQGLMWLMRSPTSKKTLETISWV